MPQLIGDDGDEGIAGAGGILAYGNGNMNGNGSQGANRNTRQSSADIERYAGETDGLLANGIRNGHASYGGAVQQQHKPARSVRHFCTYSYYKLRVILTSNYVNILLFFVPLGIIAGELGWPSTAVFVLNFLAIIPLAALLSFATEELALEVGETLGGLMNATFGNAVELIVGSLRP